MGEITKKCIKQLILSGVFRLPLCLKIVSFAAVQICCVSETPVTDEKGIRKTIIQFCIFVHLLCEDADFHNAFNRQPYRQ